MSDADTMEAEDSFARTDICENCDREIVAELVKLEGQHELILKARQADDGFVPITGGKATISFSCRCSHAQIEFGPGSASAWEIPDEWLWESKFGEGGVRGNE